MDTWHDVGHVARRGHFMGILSIKLKQKRIWERGSPFYGLCVTEEKGREKKEIQTSLFDLRSFVGWNSSSQERTFIYSTRAMHEYRKYRISPMIQTRSSGNQRFRVKEFLTRLPRVSSTLQEAMILSTLVYFPL